MQDTINNVEEQPLPEAGSGEDQAAFQAQVDELGRQLMRKFQLNGMQFNALELELRVFILVEQVNVLTKMLQQLLPGALTDAQLTNSMVSQVGLLAKTLEGQMAKAPRIAVAQGAPRGLNGSKHN
jgi:hypothetical protein